MSNWKRTGELARDCARKYSHECPWRPCARGAKASQTLGLRLSLVIPGAIFHHVNSHRSLLIPKKEERFSLLSYCGSDFPEPGVKGKTPLPQLFHSFMTSQCSVGHQVGALSILFQNTTCLFSSFPLEPGLLPSRGQQGTAYYLNVVTAIFFNYIFTQNAIK
jgi:hypothetical protein